jgi:RNA polymerase sigma-70 factor (ECF subfamily)
MSQVQGRAVSIDDAIDEFAVANYPRLVRLAALICGDPHEAQDAVQAGLERAWRNRSNLRDDERLRGWLDRIVVREAIRIRSRRGSWFARLIGTVREITPDLPATRSEVDSRDEWVDLRVSFDRLTPQQRAVVALHLYRGYPIAETAEILGIPVETARSRLRVAREHLRGSLSEMTR